MFYQSLLFPAAFDRKQLFLCHSFLISQKQAGTALRGTGPFFVSVSVLLNRDKSYAGNQFLALFRIYIIEQRLYQFVLSGNLAVGSHYERTA